MNDDSPSTRAINAALNQDWNSAVKINKEILKEDPENLDALNRLGRSLLELGELPQATLNFKRALRIDKYNQIALRNLDRISQLDKRMKNPLSSYQTQRVYCDFIEEPGKTKIVNLVNIAGPKILSALSTTDSVSLKPRRHTMIVSLNDELQTYIGSLPDDLGHRLALLVDHGNTYECFIKSCGNDSITIFIRELTRGKKMKHISSFSSSTDKSYHDGDDEQHENANYKAIKTSDSEPTEDEEDVTKTIKKLNDDDESDKADS